MSISIVTVVLDAGADLPLTIESVRQQTFSDVELIVVDGGSQDTTAGVLELYSDLIDHLVRIEDAGIYDAMNAALVYCSKEYVLFLNAKDTLYAASTLSNLMDCKLPDVDVFFGNHIYVDRRSEYFKRSLAYDVSMKSLRRGLIDHTWLARLPGHQATFVRLDLLRRLRFDTAVLICADHDLMVRAYNSGATFQYIDETVSHYVGGGFSAQNPGRLALEWCALYRDQSRDPAAVDRFFLGDTPSPFGPQNSYTGVWICGICPLDHAQPEQGIIKPVVWLRPGAKLRTSAHHASAILQIEGYNPFEDQVLTFLCGDDAIVEIRPELGWFRQSLLLTSPVPPLAVVDVIPLHLGETPLFSGRTVMLAVASFAFEPAVSGERLAVPGDCIVFSQANELQTKRLLADGWSHQEEGHIWTIGRTASVRLEVASTVSTLIVRCLGNPFVEAPDERGVDILLNGKPAGRYQLSGNTQSDVEIDLGPAFIDGLLEVVFRPLKRLSAPADSRLLGIALKAIEFR